MFSYLLNQGIQCYICKTFGHLCCVNSANTSSRVISCYRCGEWGHTGLVSYMLCFQWPLPFWVMQLCMCVLVSLTCRIWFNVEVDMNTYWPIHYISKRKKEEHLLTYWNIVICKNDTLRMIIMHRCCCSCIRFVYLGYGFFSQ